VYKHDTEGIIALWGVNDADGVYEVAQSEYTQTTARSNVYNAAKSMYSRLKMKAIESEQPV